MARRTARARSRSDGAGGTTASSIWIGPRGPHSRRIVSRGLERGFHVFAIDPRSKEARQGRLSTVEVKGGRILRDGRAAGASVRIASRADVERIERLLKRGEDVLVDARHWKIIPLENLIAAAQGAGARRGRLIAVAEGMEEARLALEVLEHGVDGVLFRTSDPGDVDRLHEYLERRRGTRIGLVDARVTELRPLGMGERVCVDTCAMMSPGEGLLVGSQSRALFLVHSESLESEYVPARPVRVNAGPVHAYTLLPGGRTCYLSELRSGSRVLVVDSRGDCRESVVGRVKIERRPLLLVRAVGKAAGRRVELSTIVQNAETIRLVSGGRPVSVVDLLVGAKVLAWLGGKARHFGMAIDESIVER
jgi:3-dehydroquinate synthase II